LTESDISDGGQTRPFLEGANSLEPDQGSDISGRLDISYGGQICPTGPDCNASRTRLGIRRVRSVRYILCRSDIYDLEPLPRLWNPMVISDLNGYVRCNIIYLCKLIYYTANFGDQQIVWLV
jgi:hypothetical protein